MAPNNEERYHLPDTSRVDRGPFEGDHCLVVRAAQRGGRERHMAWVVDFYMDFASDDEDFDTAAELQAEINSEWDEVMVVWMNGDRGLPEEVPAASVEVVARNALRRPMRTRRQPNRYSDGQNAGLPRSIAASSVRRKPLSRLRRQRRPLRTGALQTTR